MDTCTPGRSEQPSGSIDDQLKILDSCGDFACDSDCDPGSDIKSRFLRGMKTYPARCIRSTTARNGAGKGTDELHVLGRELDDARCIRLACSAFGSGITVETPETRAKLRPNSPC